VRAEPGLGSKEGILMRVLMLGWEFPPYIRGGLGTACFGLTEALSRRGVEIIFVMPNIKGEIVSSHVEIRMASQVEKSLHFAHLNSYPVWRGHTFTGEYGGDILSEVEAYGRAAGLIAEKERFDLIHAHDWMTVYGGLAARGKTGRPYIYHVHSLEFDRSGDNVNRDIFEIEKLGLLQADHIISVSNYTKEMTVRRYGISPEKITVVHNAVSHKEGTEKYRVQKRPGEKVVLFLGRITFQKGPDYFVEAARKVIGQVPDVTFVMAGTGDMMPRMVERVASLGLGRHFRFTGFLKGEEVERMYAISDLYVMPSVSEPFGITPLEAMLYDVPVIISRQSGVSEIIHHALKVDFWNVEELAHLIISVLRHPALAWEMTERSRDELRNIHWERAADRVIGVYNSLSQRKD